MVSAKKGLASGIFIIIILMFLFALSSLLALKGWNEVNGAIQSVNESYISDAMKEKIDNKVTPIFSWGDKLFVALFMALLVSYLITSATLPPEKPVFLLVFLGLLIVTTLLAMALSNAWNFIENLSVVSAEAAQLKFTGYFMYLYPYITLIVGIAGAIIFYSRAKQGGDVSEF